MIFNILKLVLIILCLSVPLFALDSDFEYYIEVASRIFIFALFAMSLDFLMGYGKLASMGHAIFFGIGAYSVGILAFHGGAWFGSNNWLFMVSVAILITLIISFIIGSLTLKSSGVFFIMLTLAFGQLFFYFFNSLRIYGGEDGLNIDTSPILPFIGELGTLSLYYLAFLIWLMFYYISKKILKSRFGLVFQAIAHNEQRMKALGYPTHQYKLVGFMYCAVVASIAGAMFAVLNLFVSPQVVHWIKSADALIMVVLGGMGTLIGPLFGASLLLLVEEFLAPVFEWWKLALGLLIIVVVMLRQGGIYHLIKKLLPNK